MYKGKWMILVDLNRIVNIVCELKDNDIFNVVKNMFFDL